MNQSRATRDKKDSLRSRSIDWLFPAESRQFYGQRWLNILLRSVHLLGVAGVGGGFLLGVEDSRWMVFWILTLTTGVALSLLYVWSNALWLFQLKGVAIITKLLCLTTAIALPAWRAELFSVAVIISAVIAHAPAKVRGYLILMRHRQGEMRC